MRLSLVGEERALDGSRQIRLHLMNQAQLCLQATTDALDLEVYGLLLVPTGLVFRGSDYLTAASVAIQESATCPNTLQL